MKAYIFPGQGSQAKGMGGELFDKFDHLTQKADKILGYSIKDLCLQDPNKELNLTQFTQPALFIVNAFSYFNALQEADTQPDFVMGHSLGEFNALLAAGCFDFETGLKLVIKRSELMSQATNGGMAAILNATEQEIIAILESNGLDQIDLANFNSQKQIVISGSKEQIDKAHTYFSTSQFMFIPLNTSGAFHSRLMADAKAQFEQYLNGFEFSAPAFPVIANFTAKPYETNNIKQTLASQIAGSVRWFESVKRVLDIANQANEELEFIECGHGEVQTKMITKIKRELDIKPINNKPKIVEAKQAPSPEVGKHVYVEASKSISPVEKIQQWNSCFPVGSKFKSDMTDFGVLRSCTEATVLFGHRAAVYMEGVKGYFDIDQLTEA